MRSFSLSPASPPTLCLQRLPIPQNCRVKQGISSPTKPGSWACSTSSAGGVKSWIELSTRAAGLYQPRRKGLSLLTSLLCHFRVSYMAQSNQSLSQEHTPWKSDNSASSCSFLCFIMSKVLTHRSFFTWCPQNRFPQADGVRTRQPHQYNFSLRSCHSGWSLRGNSGLYKVFSFS